jgi:hypothetical protein
MGTVIILPKEFSVETEIDLVDNGSLPVNYMSDYSVIALRVEKFEQAQRRLEKESVRLKKLPIGYEIVVNGIGHLKALLKLLAIHGIKAEFTDIATPIYQG